jgi:hypothetical protein
MPDMNRSYRISRKPFEAMLTPIPSRPLQQRDGKVARIMSRNAEMRASHFGLLILRRQKKQEGPEDQYSGFGIGPVGGVGTTQM